MIETKAEVKERPILFSGPMVRAILEGRKTQTRRVAKLSYVQECYLSEDYGTTWTNGVVTEQGGPRPDYVIPHCPYGKVGERLWVRETLIKCQDSPLSIPVALYKTGRQQVLYYGELAEWGWKHNTLPGIHMPRWASRITLEITEVRVQRLQDISEQDAKAEGVQIRDVLYADEPQSAYSYVEQFKLVWDSINGKRGFTWASNPWVWAISFKRICAP